MAEIRKTRYAVRVAPNMAFIKSGMWAQYNAVDYDDALTIFNKWKQDGAQCAIVKTEITIDTIEYSTPDLKKYWS